MSAIEEVYGEDISRSKHTGYGMSIQVKEGDAKRSMLCDCEQETGEGACG